MYDSDESKQKPKPLPGSAFGTGSHPSTRLCIEALDNDPPVGKIIADLGCGSGILSLIDTIGSLFGPIFSVIVIDYFYLKSVE